jgi:hypothetical protein
MQSTLDPPPGDKLVHRFRESDPLVGIPSVTARLVVHLVVNTGGDHGSGAACGRVVGRS